jgi:hypothetical protein
LKLGVSRKPQAQNRVFRREAAASDFLPAYILAAASAAVTARAGIVYALMDAAVKRTRVAAGTVAGFLRSNNNVTPDTCDNHRRNKRYFCNQTNRHKLILTFLDLRCRN